MQPLRWTILALLLLYSVRPLFAADSDVKAELFADTTAIEAGKPFRIAVRLTPHLHWHIYWQNPGQAGLSTKVAPHLPDGFTATPLAYPLPEKLTLAGGIINYGYDHPTTFVTTITPPSPLPAGQPFALRAHASWLSCSDSCVPGKADLDLALPSGAATPANVDIFGAADDALPASAIPPTVESIAPCTLQDGHVAFHIQWKDDVDHVELFPLPPDSTDVSNIVVKTQDRQSMISFDARVLAGQDAKAATLPVLIVYTPRAGKPQGFYTDINLHAPAAGAAH